MMSRLKFIVFFASIVSACIMLSEEAQAGPLLDWLRGVRRPGIFNSNNSIGARQTRFFAQAPDTLRTPTGQQTGAPNPAGLLPGQCMKTCNQTCSRTVVNYVPYTAYRTNWNRVPVTQYRPVTSSDPCTGCTMTCMKPCTTFTYKMQRVPYTTYRPVYRTERYSVPVTTITNNCATGTCDTCATPGSASRNFGPTQTTSDFSPTPATQDFSTPTFSAPSTSGSIPAADTAPSISVPSGSTSRLPVPTNTISTQGNFQAQSPPAGSGFTPSAFAPTPQRPTPHTASAGAIDSATRGVRPPTRQRSFLNRLESHRSNGDLVGSVLKQADRRNDASPQTNMRSLRRRWSYAPVRLARNDVDANLSSTRFTSVAPPTSVDRKSINDAWEDVR